MRIGSGLTHLYMYPREGSFTSPGPNFITCKSFTGLPSQLSGKESACQGRRHRFGPWSWNVPQAAEQLRPWATWDIPQATEQLSPSATATDTRVPRVCALQKEATTVRSPHTETTEEPLLTATRESPHATLKTQHSQK